jgi:hypothetical protein
MKPAFTPRYIMLCSELGMEMSFPHLHSNPEARIARQNYRALLASATSRQGNSPTGQAMVAAMHKPVSMKTICEDTVRPRIRYFAAVPFPNSAECAPYGSFSTQDNNAFSKNANYDQAVYQDGLGNRKQNAVLMSLSELQTATPGQEN